MSHVVFGNRREIHEWLRKKFASTLSEKQRSLLEEKIASLLDAGEVTRAEVEYTLTRELRELRDTHAISSFEYNAILSSLREKQG